MQSMMIPSASAKLDKIVNSISGVGVGVQRLNANSSYSNG